jgi:hypothetical protein
MNARLPFRMPQGRSPEGDGYASAAYARALAEFGHPRALPRSGGWLLERSIPGTPYRDAMGCYPLFACERWSFLQRDLQELPPELVSVVLVTDPFGGFELRDLERCFPDLMVAFKEHFVVDLRRPLASIGTAHHRRNVRKALGALAVEHDGRPADLSAEWTALYERLIARHDIRGAAAFSSTSLARQLAVPGLVAFRAQRGAETVGMMLWYVRGDVAYYHLAAYRDDGYRHGASFALVWRALELFGGRGLSWLSLGAGAGPEADPSDGLSRFKRGWATDTRRVYLCGRVCDGERYAALAARADARASRWFPAYRAAERPFTTAPFRRAGLGRPVDAQGTHV